MKSLGQRAYEANVALGKARPFLRTSSCGSCGRCGRPVAYALSDVGRKVAVDLAPTPAGSLVLFDRGGTLCVRALARDEARDGQTFTTHSIACPKQPRRWRRLVRG